MSQIDLDSLPENIRAQIAELNKPVKERFPIVTRSYTSAGFQTKEIKELGEKVDELIQAVNTLYESSALAASKKAQK